MGRWLDSKWNGWLTIAIWVYLDVKIWPLMGNDPKGLILKLIFVISFPVVSLKLRELMRPRS
jgi:hypothetical protein